MATPDDFTAIQSLYEDFTGENMKEIVTLNKEIVSESIKRMISQGALLTATYQNRPIGFIAGHFLACHFSNDVMFSVMFFYVQDKYRKFSIHFLKAVEKLLQNTPATKIVMSSPAFKDSEKYDRFYQMNGYVHLESHFSKGIPHANRSL
jgi:hypothetical protein